MLKPLVLISRAYGARSASSEFPDGARHSFAAAYGRRADRIARARGLERRSLTP